LWSGAVCSAGFEPKIARLCQGIDTAPLPPCDFVGAIVDFAVVNPAQWYSELVADFPAEGAALREAKVVGIRGTAPADKAGLLRNELDVGLVANSARLGKGQFVFVDSIGRGWWRGACNAGVGLNRNGIGLSWQCGAFNFRCRDAIFAKGR
jgi:hypothetical protein